MAVSFLKSEQREHLKLLREKPPDVVVDFCKLALDYLTNGPSEKKYTTVAKKINTSPELIQSTVEALVFLLIDSKKSNVAEAEFEYLKTLGFSADTVSILGEFVASKRNFVDNILKSTSTKDLRFKDIEWRLEAKIASRSLLNQSTPIITLKFYLDTQPIGENREVTHVSTEQRKSDTQQEVIAQTDPHNLAHIIEVLEEALVESKTHRSRNIVKAFQ